MFFKASVGNTDFLADILDQSPLDETGCYHRLIKGRNPTFNRQKVHELLLVNKPLNKQKLKLVEKVFGKKQFIPGGLVTVV